MRRSQIELLSLIHLPKILELDQVGDLMNFTDYEVRHLASVKHLPVLGGAKGSEHKQVCTAELLRLLDDPDWCSEARRLIIAHWRRKNASRRDKNDGDDGVAATG